MGKLDIASMLEALGSPDPGGAWSGFLDTYSPLILQVVRLHEKDADPVADCFLFVCEQLNANRCRRLRSFQLDGPASFETWLRAVVRNLCVDWHRNRFGRKGAFRSIASLPIWNRKYSTVYMSKGSERTTRLRFAYALSVALQGSAWPKGSTRSAALFHRASSGCW